MIFATLLLFALSALNGYASEKKREANCTVVIAADLHFDLPPYTGSVGSADPATVRFTTTLIPRSATTTSRPKAADRSRTALVWSSTSIISTLRCST